MASITLAGTLLDPNSDLAIGDQIRFTHQSTTGQTLRGSAAVVTMSLLGTYSVNLQYGLVLVEYKDILDAQFRNLGIATVNSDNPATSIPELLNALTPVSSAELIEFQGILADAVAAKEAAEEAADSFDNQLTTLDLIGSTSTFLASTIINTRGYATSGDGGNASWKQNGQIGQTPSQTPKQLNSALLNDGNGKQWSVVSSNLLTLKSLGAVDNDNETSLLNSLVATRPIVSDLDLYYISSTVVLNRQSLDTTYCSLRATTDLLADEPVIHITGTSTSSTVARPPADVNVVVQGNGVYSFPTFTTEPVCDGVLLEANRSITDRFNFYVQDCMNGVVLKGDNERRPEINVYAAACDTAVRVVETGGASGDEVIVNITGGYCRTWLHTAQGEENAEYRFNVEANNSDDALSNSDRWGVVLGGGKNIKVSGVIRGHNGNLFKVYRLNAGDTTWRDAVVFDNMTVIQCDDGVAFTARRVDRLSGMINLYDCDNDTGPTASINDMRESESLQIVINKCFSLYGMRVGEFTSFDNSYLYVSISMGDVYSTSPNNLTALKVDQASNSTFDCKILKGNIDLTGANACTFLMNKSFVNQGFTLTGGITSIIRLRGSYSSIELSDIAWLDEVKSVYIDSFDDTSSPMVYTNGAWNSTVGLSATAVDLGNKSSTINQILKSAGVSVFNTTNSKSYNSAGSGATDAWVPSDGSANITPAYASQTTAYESRLPTAISTQDKDAYDRLFALLVSYGILGNLSNLYMLSANAANNALINLIDASDPLVVNGDCSHTALLGYSSSSANGTGFLDGMSNAPTIADSMMGAYFGDTTSNAIRDCESGASRWNLRGRDGTGGYVEMGSDIQSGSTGGGSVRLLHGTRIGTQQRLYSRGALQNTDAATQSYGMYDMEICKSDRNMSAFMFGSAISITESSQLNLAMEEFRVLLNA
jgi:hypothetical protein